MSNISNQTTCFLWIDAIDFDVDNIFSHHYYKFHIDVVKIQKWFRRQFYCFEQIHQTCHHNIWQNNVHNWKMRNHFIESIWHNQLKIVENNYIWSKQKIFVWFLKNRFQTIKSIVIVFHRVSFSNWRSIKTHQSNRRNHFTFFHDNHERFNWMIKVIVKNSTTYQ